jgi:hypothetical protein
MLKNSAQSCRVESATRELKRHHAAKDGLYEGIVCQTIILFAMGSTV